MSIIKSIRTMMAECEFLEDFAPGHVDFADLTDPESYGIFPTGELLLWEDMAGNSRWQYNFVLQAVDYTMNDTARLQNSEFIERLCSWFYERSRTITGFPVDVLSLTAQNGQFVDKTEDGNAGVYQVPCVLIYEKEK